ncbi:MULTISPECIES: DUF4446 family protein [unclassified Paenibacillus]|uniref:DUF4446 family protein n=1 Tax=unclassified Paenibacillus TaxID=185978 RepID=UPI002F3EB846
MMEWVEEPIAAIALAVALVMALILFLMLIWVIRLSGRLKRLTRQYRAFMEGSSVDDLEQVIINMKNNIFQNEEQIKIQGQQLQQVQAKLPTMSSKVGINRYNAFGDRGNDLSFSIAIVNETEDGMVLTGIHSRETTYVYAKPLEKGTSNYPLTPEELKAIREAK